MKSKKNNKIEINKEPAEPAANCGTLEASKEIAAAEETEIKKKSALSRMKNFFEVKNQKKQVKLEQNLYVANTLSSIDKQLNMLSGHNHSLLEEVNNLRAANQTLITEIAKIRKREMISKIIATISGIISVALIILKVVQWVI